MHNFIFPIILIYFISCYSTNTKQVKPNNQQEFSKDLELQKSLYQTKKTREICFQNERECIEKCIENRKGYVSQPLRQMANPAGLALMFGK